MKIIIANRNSETKGAELEKLCKKIFVKLGFESSTLNVVAAGANEYDVRAYKRIIENGIDTLIPVMAECKAYNKKCDITHWEKFLGKLYTLKLQHPKAQGFFIALSGVNGNFWGAYDAIKETDDSILLITEEKLLEYIHVEFNLSSSNEIHRIVATYTNRVIDTLDILLYDNKIFWLIQFNSKDYSILSAENEIPSQSELDCIIPLLPKNIFYNYINLLEEQKRNSRIGQIKGLIICFALNNMADNRNSVISELRACNSDITIDEFEKLIKDTEFISNTYPLKVDIPDCRIQFYKSILSSWVYAKTLTSPIYQKNIDVDLVDEILSLHGGLELDSKQIQQCIYLLKHSHTALLNVIHSDNFIKNALKNIGLFNKQKQHRIRIECATKFFDLLLDGLKEDFTSQPYWEIMSALGIDRYCLTQKLILNEGLESEFTVDTSSKTNLMRLSNVPGNPIVPITLLDE